MEVVPDTGTDEVYRNNFGENPFEDVTKIQPDALEEFDVLVAGFPGQPFSICGKKQEFEDTRGTLFFEICRIVEFAVSMGKAIAKSILNQNLLSNEPDEPNKNSRI